MIKKYTVPISTGGLNLIAKNIEDEITKNRSKYSLEGLKKLQDLYRSIQTSSGLANELTDLLEKEKKI